MVANNSSNIPSVNATAVVGTGSGFSSLGYSTDATASNLVSRDASANISANAIIEGYATTATAAGTTTLLVGSAKNQFFTGATTQTVLLPVTSTLVLGQQFIITNNSSGIVTVQSSGANTIQAMAANTQLVMTVILTSGTSAASWNLEYSSQNGGGSSIPSTATSLQVLQSVASSNPVWSTATYPATTTINRLLFSSAANVVGQIATANSSLLVTNSSGVPSLTTTLPSGLGVSASNSGTNVSFSVANTNTNNASNSRIVISCANGASSTFAYLAINPNLTGNQFNIGASAPTATGLNVWAGSSPVGGTLVSSMDFTGVQTLPLQPAFLAYLGTADANVTGDGTVYSLGQGNALTEAYDQGSNFTTAGVFTAPFDGAYHFDMTITLTGLVVQTSARIQMVIAGSTYLGPLLNPTPSIVSGELTISFGVTAKMLATNTATFQVVSSGSTLTVGISGTGISSCVSGYKVA